MKMDRLISLRKSHKMTQEEMSSLVGVSRKTYRHWEYGEREIKAVDLKKIASILCVPMEYLMGDGDAIEAKDGVSTHCLEAPLPEGGQPAKRAGGSSMGAGGRNIEIEIELPNKSKVRFSIPADTDEEKICKLITHTRGG